MRLRDDRARALLALRLDRLAYGHVGDARNVGAGVSELYCARRGNAVILLLCGGDKGSQARDISMAKQILAEWNE